MDAFRSGNTVTLRDQHPALALAAAVDEAAAARLAGEDRIVELGRFQLLRVLGRGGMGQVFEAWDPQLERHVAIKLLLQGGAQATLEEARCLARLAHPNVVMVHELGRVDELDYIAMELIDGPDLRRWLRERPREPAAVVEVVLAAGRALAAVHEAGLLHGDVKPGNVLIGADGRVRVADFGLARLGVQPVSSDLAPTQPRSRRLERSRTRREELDELVRSAVEAVDREMVEELLFSGSPELDEPIDEPPEEPIEEPPDERGSDLGEEQDSDQASLPELVLDDLRSLIAAASSSAADPRGGTVPYMAPERLQGDSGGPAADQYGLCATAWEALYGVCPFAGDDRRAVLAAIAVRRISRGGGRPRGVSRAVEAVLLRGLAERPEQRWPSIDALCSALERAQARPRRRARRITAATLLFGSVIGVGAALMIGEDPSEAAARCERQGRALVRSWGPERRAALERRLAAAELPFPRSEARFVGARLDAWVSEWASLWGRACLGEPKLARCLERERGRFDAVLALLEHAAPASELLAAGRTLVVELGSPASCLETERAPGLDADELDRVVELSAVQRRIELAVLAGAHERAATELASFDALLAAREEVDASPLTLHRLSVEPWRARVLAATGELEQARARLREGVRDAERLGFDDLRFALELEQARLRTRLLPGPSPRPRDADPVATAALDELARLDGLAERLEPGPVFRAELALVRAAAGGEPVERVAELDEAAEALAGSRQPTVELRFELNLRRAQLHFESGDLQPALSSAEQAAGIGRELYGRLDTRPSQALAIAGVSAALLGQCDRVRTPLEELWMVAKLQDAANPLDHWTLAVPALDGVDWKALRERCPYRGADLQALLDG